MSRWLGDERGDDIFTVRPNGRGVRHVTKSEGDEQSPAWSPDGRRIAFQRVYDRTRQPSALWIMDRSGSDQEKLHEATSIRDFDWSPDGSKIVFTAYDEGRTELYVIDVSSKELDTLTDTPAEEWTLSWSPDGTRIAFSSETQDGDQNIYSISPSGEDSRQLTEDGLSSSPVWSPGGTHIAFQTPRDDETPSEDDGPFTEIYVMDANGDEETRVSHLANSWDGDIAWASNEVLVWRASYTDSLVAPGRRYPRIYIARRDGSERRRLAATRGFSNSSPTPSPDGRWIAFSRHRDGAYRRSGLFKIRIDGSDESKVLPTTNHNAAPSSLHWIARSDPF